MVGYLGWESQGFTGTETETLLWSKSAALLGHFCSFPSLFSLHDLLRQSSLCPFYFLRTWASLGFLFAKVPYPPEEFFATLLPLLTGSGSQFPIQIFWERHLTAQLGQGWEAHLLVYLAPGMGRTRNRAFWWNLAVDRVAWSRLQPEQVLMDISSS